MSLRVRDEAELSAMGLGINQAARAKLERTREARTGRPRKPRRQATPRPDFESLLAFQISASMLPLPDRQVKYATGRKVTADFGWPAFRLLVEVQGGIWRRGGGAHGGGAAIEKDIEKSQLAVINGWAMFPVTTDEVKSGKALQLIELALQTKGWKR